MSIVESCALATYVAWLAPVVSFFVAKAAAYGWMAGQAKYYQENIFNPKER